MLIVRWLLFLSVAALSSRHGEHPQQKLDSPDNRDEPTNWEQPERPAGEAPQQGWHPQEEKHRRREWRYWRFSILLSVAIAVGAGLSAFYAYKAVEAAQAQAQAARDQTYIAENALIAANRPWIKVTTLEISRVEVKTDSVIVAANIGVKNVGASPAARTFIRTKLLPDGSIIDTGREAEAMCQKTVADGYPPFEALVFPNEPHNFFEAVIADMSLFKKNRENRIRETYEANRPIFGERFARTHRDEDEAVPLHAGLTLIGCAVYIIPVGSFAGQTAFIYDIDHVCDDVPRGICAFDMTQAAVYTAKKVIIRDPVGGTFAR